MSIHDIEDKDTVLIIKIPDTKNGVERIFTVLNPNNNIDFLAYIRRYMALRPSDIATTRLFLKFNGNKCSKQPIGINTFGKIPSIIAEYLKLPNPSCYTGHSFRRSSATMLANSGGDLLTVKKHGGWKSSTVAEGYVDNTITKKIDVSRKILTSNVASTHTGEKSIEDYNVTVSKPTCEGTVLSSEGNEVVDNDTSIPSNQNITITSVNNSVSETSNVLCNSNNNSKAHGLPFNNCSFNNCTFNININ